MRAAQYLGHDAEYHNYSSWMNNFIYPCETKTNEAMKRFRHTEIIARDACGNVTFHHRQRGIMSPYRIEVELRRWAIDREKESVYVRIV